MTGTIIYLYLVGFCVALHLTSYAPDERHIGKVLFAVCWPVICPAIYAWAIIKALRQ